jgi:hypothetical protein
MGPFTVRTGIQYYRTPILEYLFQLTCRDFSGAGTWFGKNGLTDKLD